LSSELVESLRGCLCRTWQRPLLQHHDALAADGVCGLQTEPGAVVSSAMKHVGVASAHNLVHAHAARLARIGHRYGMAVFSKVTWCLRLKGNSRTPSAGGAKPSQDRDSRSDAVPAALGRTGSLQEQQTREPPTRSSAGEPLKTEKAILKPHAYQTLPGVSTRVAAQQVVQYVA
jgi:hypothetical protein